MQYYNHQCRCELKCHHYCAIKYGPKMPQETLCFSCTQHQHIQHARGRLMITCYINFYFIIILFIIIILLLIVIVLL